MKKAHADVIPPSFSHAIFILLRDCYIFYGESDRFVIDPDTFELLPSLGMLPMFSYRPF